MAHNHAGAGESQIPNVGIANDAIDPTKPSFPDLSADNNTVTTIAGNNLGLNSMTAVSPANVGLGLYLVDAKVYIGDINGKGELVPRDSGECEESLAQLERHE